jgi:hypothetical protein
MKRLFLVFVLLCASAFAQVDIPINTIGPIRDLARNWLWTGSGTGTLNNNYIFTPTYTNEGVCIGLANNDTVNGHSFTIFVYGTTDQTVHSYQSNQGAWALLGPVSNLPTGGGSVGLLVSQTKNVFVASNGMASMAVVITGGGSTGTGTITIVESPNGTACGNATSGPVYCPLTLSVAVTGSGVTPVLANSAGQATYVCGITVTASGALAAGNIQFEYGTGATCTTPFVYYQLLTATTSPVFMSMDGSPLISRFRADGADSVNKYLCIANNQTTAIEVALNLAQF